MTDLHSLSIKQLGEGLRARKFSSRELTAHFLKRIEAHDGKIWVEDNPGGGSVFSFVLQPANAEEVLKCGQSVSSP